MLKVTGTTGVLSTAVVGTDYLCRTHEFKRIGPGHRHRADPPSGLLRHSGNDHVPAGR
jgi:hypothetical protein